MNISAIRKTAVFDRLYDQSFYDEQIRGSLTSARIFLGYLFNFYKPRSVLDVGCGRGTWLKICGELGAENLFGLDGPWNNQQMMLVQEIEFSAVDLNTAFNIHHKVDLAMSLEVAEHLKPESAESFVQSLSSASDVILFSAAFKGQTGVNHINERYPSYWGKLFLSNGFAVFDMFRPKFWMDTAVEPWYRQNAFLYVRRSHDLFFSLKEQGIHEMADIAFMDCVHPWMYETRRGSFKEHLKDFFPSFARAVRRRIS